MENEIDGILDPENNKIKLSKKQESTKNRLDGLKELMKSDNVHFNSSEHLPGPFDFPVNTNIRLIDYSNEDTICNSMATETIDAIILNYIHSEGLLNADKLKSIKKGQINKLADLELLVRNSKRNMILLQEGIDSGDMGKDMFDGVQKFQVEMRTNIEARSKHIDKCEIYWDNYSKMYGLENKEEEIIRKTESKIEEIDKKTIFNQTDLNLLIEKQMEENKKKMETSKSNSKKKTNN